MDRVAVFVDAGYLFAQGSIELSGEKLSRSALVLDFRAAVDALRRFAEDVSKRLLLRIYWYDGTNQGPTSPQIALARLNDVKVRLGIVNASGHQKGVDSLIVTDMISLARNGAMADCVLLTGDEDLRIGVQQAQQYGVRVHLLGIKPVRSNQSSLLYQEADTTHEWGRSALSKFMRVRHTDSRKVEPHQGSIGPVHDHRAVNDRLRTIAVTVAQEIPEAELKSLSEGIAQVGRRPKEIDSQLLALAKEALGRYLSGAEKRLLRDEFGKVLAVRSD